MSSPSGWPIHIQPHSRPRAELDVVGPLRGALSSTKHHKVANCGSSGWHLHPDCPDPRTGNLTPTMCGLPARHPESITSQQLKEALALGTHTWGWRHPGWTRASESWEVFLWCGAGDGAEGPGQPWGLLWGPPRQGCALRMSVHHDTYWHFSFAQRGLGGLLSPRGLWGVVRGRQWG